MVFRQLYITLPSGMARVVDLASITMIGRDSQNDIVLDDAVISRYHAMLFAKPQGIVLIDLESTNGTLVNGKLVLPDTPVLLEDGTVIAFGSVIACYREGVDRHPGRLADTLDILQATAKDFFDGSRLATCT